MRVIEAKLKVYREYKTVIDSSNIFLQHVYDDFDEIAKLSVHNKLTWLCNVVQTISKSVDLEHLKRILKKAVDSPFSEENISQLRSKEFYYKFFNFLFSENPKRRAGPLQEMIEYLESKINFEISQQVKSLIDRENLPPLKLDISKVLNRIFISLLTEDVYYNSEEDRERFARDIYCKRRKIFKKISCAIRATSDDLKKVSRRLIEIKQDLKLVDQKEGK